MRIIANYENRQFTTRSYGVRVMFLAGEPDAPSVRRLSEYGSRVDTEADFEVALGALVQDPLGYDLLVMNCDAYGGIAGGERAVAMLIAAEARMRVILISKEFDVPCYPMGLRTAVCLPAPVSKENLRRGYQHVLRDRQSVHVS